ncbi:MAG: inorganic phosphate transporter [Salinivirgaceae bacterium]|nr:inorganic phosphate transporter [Salinivirgaceae bacterium]
MDMYLIFIFVLFALAISDLMVGVANDAVNFLNSAIGAKVAPRNIIMIVASLGILLGATFASGMMEVARKGLFYPEHLLFTEVIILFMAVMFTDVLLLDFFNTFGLPTSTTVSLVFGLLGAAVGISWLKVMDGATIMVDGIAKVAQVGDFINSAKALTIISSILLSVVFSFVFGIVVQWISRLIFSFNFEKTMKYYGSLWSGLAIAAITYFILIKGLKDASFMTKENYQILKDNTLLIMLAAFIGSAAIMQLLYGLFKINPLKIVVMLGTFGLALAFAGNDLVNFIGVPMAGLESFRLFQANSGNDLLMGGLNQPVAAETYILIIAGIIMVLTLWFSKKARTVTETELNLSRQDEGAERFGSSIFARVLVRRVIRTGTFFSTVIPQPVIAKISKRFDQSEFNERVRKEKNPPMFDLVRASVNLVVSSVLIAIGTSYKLPLSTTYVTFMVAMSSSLVDGAWGRDSAVYRITGVFSVIGGWFVTALAAFAVALGISIFVKWAGLIGVIIMVGLAVFAFYRTHLTHKKRSKEKQLLLDEAETSTSVDNLFEKSTEAASKIYKQVTSTFSKAVEALTNENRKELKSLASDIAELNEKIKKQKNNVHKTMLKLQIDNSDSGNYYVQILDFQRDIANSLEYLVEPLLSHVENQHKPITPEQAVELNELAKSINVFSKFVQSVIHDATYDKLPEVTAKQVAILDYMKTMRKNQIKRIQQKEVGNKNSNLYLNMLLEVRKLMAFQVNMLISLRDFVEFQTNRKA